MTAASTLTLFRMAALPLALALVGLLSPALHVQAAESAPALMLAKVYRPGTQLQDYWVSEKYDGVRAYWDGQRLLTRSGQPIAAPPWFTKGWPKTALDGELWAGRGRFAKAVSTARQQGTSPASDEDWRGMRFMVFDLPAHAGPFTERIGQVAQVVASIDQPWVQPVRQAHVASHAALESLLKKTVSQAAKA